MAGPPPSPRAASRPLIPLGAEWTVAPLPLLFALIARFLGPTDARDIASDWLFLTTFQLFLPAVALLAGSRACWRPAGEQRIDWRPGQALLACAAGALLGQVVLDQRGVLAGTMIPAVTWVTGLCLPLWASCLLTSRRWWGARALAWAGATVLAGIACAFAAAVALHLDDLAAGEGLATGGAVWTVLAVVLARSTPSWLRSGTAVVTTGGLVAGLPAVAMVVWLGTPPAWTYVPYYVHEPVLQEAVLVEGFSPRTGAPRTFEIRLDDLSVTPLSRRVDQVCTLRSGVRAIHVQGLGQPMQVALTAPRTALIEDGRFELLPGRTGGELGLLRCSMGDQLLWVAGSTMRIWDPPAGLDWSVRGDGEDVAFPCFTAHQPGVLYRLRGDDPPPYPLRYLSLVEGATPEAGAGAEAVRCAEGWNGNHDLWFERPRAHSGTPWRVHDGTLGTVTEIAERPVRIEYFGPDQAFVMLRLGEDEYRIAIWRAGEGRIAEWPSPSANRIYPMSGGREVLIVSDRDASFGPPWQLYRAADGTLLREGDSRQVWPVANTDLLELLDGTLVLHDLDGDGGEVQLLPRPVD